MGLIAAELERSGIATVAIQLLLRVARKVRPPRTLFVPFPHGYPLGSPGDPAAQKAVLVSALQLLKRRDLSPPALEFYGGDGKVIK